MNGATDLAILFAVVFALNLIPAFAPPTWMALSWIGFAYSPDSPFLVALVAAAAATAGRLLLAVLSRVIVRQRFLDEGTRANIDVVKEQIEQNRKLTFGVFLLYAFSPFASNYLFIAYGLTALPLRLVALPFFLGRAVSYSFFTLLGAEVSRQLAFTSADMRSYFGVYFLVTQLFLLGLVFAFARTDWRYVVSAKRFRWLRGGSK